MPTTLLLAPSPDFWLFLRPCTVFSRHAGKAIFPIFNSAPFLYCCHKDMNKYNIFILMFYENNDSNIISRHIFWRFFALYAVVVRYE